MQQGQVVLQAFNGVPGLANINWSSRTVPYDIDPILSRVKRQILLRGLCGLKFLVGEPNLVIQGLFSTEFGVIEDYFPSDGSQVPAP